MTISTTEAMCRRIHGAALQAGGERGSRIANRLTGALGLGTIDLSTDTTEGTTTMATEPTPETIRYTADVVVTTTDGRVLLIERGWDPHKGSWALPGGHVDQGETSRAAAARELAEEAGVYAHEQELVQLGVWDAPDRDPRGRYVTVAYHLTVLPGTIVEAGDDATRAEWWPLADLPEIAFDHAEIIAAVRDAR